MIKIQMLNESLEDLLSDTRHGVTNHRHAIQPGKAHDCFVDACMGADELGDEQVEQEDHNKDHEAHTHHQKPSWLLQLNIVLLGIHAYADGEECHHGSENVPEVWGAIVRDGHSRPEDHHYDYGSKQWQEQLWQEAASCKDEGWQREEKCTEIDQKCKVASNVTISEV